MRDKFFFALNVDGLDTVNAFFLLLPELFLTLLAIDRERAVDATRMLFLPGNTAGLG